MKPRHYIFVAAAICVYVSIIILMDPFLLSILCLVPLVLVGLPAFVVAAVVFLIALLRGHSPRPALIIMASIAGFACITGAAIPANHYVQEFAVDAAKKYPAQVEPLLEAYRQAHGTYPTSLDLLPDKPPIPRLLRSGGYRSDGSDYSFSFGQPGGLIDTWDYTNKSKSWYLST